MLLYKAPFCTVKLFGFAFFESILDRFPLMSPHTGRHLGRVNTLHHDRPPEPQLSKESGSVPAIQSFMSLFIYSM